MSSAGQQELHQAPSHDDIFVAGLILLGIGAYNVVEVFVLLLRTFRGFFFSYCLAADLSLAGLIASCSAYLCIRDFPGWLRVFWGICFTIFATTQALILWTRLRFVLPNNPHLVRTVLILIIITTIVSIPLQVYRSLISEPWTDPVRCLVVIIVAVREIVLCAIYMVQAYRELGTISLIKGPAGRRVMCDMIAVQALVIAFDVAQIGVTLGAPESIQWGYTCLVYALKLKMEFAALETLRKLLRSPVEVNQVEP